MKKLLIACLLTTQALAIPSVSAATFDDQPTTVATSHGTFAGLRFNIPLGGDEPEPRIGLAVAPMQQSEASDGSRGLRFSQGLEFGLASDGQPDFRLAGRPISKMGVAEEQDDEDGGISTLGIIGIVAGGLLVVSGIGLAVLAHEISQHQE